MELSKREKKIWRTWEIVPGAVAWFLIFLPIWGAFLIPRVVAYFVIAFLCYWVWQSFKTPIWGISGFLRIKKEGRIDWKKKYKEDKEKGDLDWDKINHVLTVPSYKEPKSVLKMTMDSLMAQEGVDFSKIWIVLALEDRSGKAYLDEIIPWLKKEYGKKIVNLIPIIHPDGVKGEVIGKASNNAWVMKKFKKEYVDTGKLNMDECTLSTCDADTIINPRFFSALTYHFATNKNRYERFWQTPINWHNNSDEVPAPIRIVGTIGNVSHLASLQDPEGLIFNYSFYSSSFKLIDSVGYWDIDIIPEDWHMFLQAFFGTQGNVKVEPIFLPTITDAPGGDTYWKALKNRYVQCERHAWGATDIPYAVIQSMRHKEIPLYKRMARLGKLLESHFVWSSNWFILTLGSSLPALLNPEFFQTALGFSLPRVSQTILTFCLIPLVVVVVLDWKLRPKYKGKMKLKKKIAWWLQWPIMPVATLFMACLPGLQSHTKLMVGKRLEYKTTEKS